MTDDLPEPAPGPRRRSSFPVPGRRSVQLGIVGALLVGLTVLLLKGADEPPDPHLRTGRQPVEGFGEIAYRVDRMASTRRCALLAQTDEQRARGLMNVTDLAGYDGMMFVFPADTETSFYMLNTPLPLSIAWFDSGGRFVSSTDMAPCLDQPDCPLYSAAGRYRYALEVPQGGLGALGIGPASVISVGGPCGEPDDG